MAKKEKPEIIDVGKNYAGLFKKALDNTSIRTYIANESISVNDEGRIEIESTRASFLITLGMEYQKLITEKENGK